MATYKYVDPIHSVTKEQLIRTPVEFWPSGSGFRFNSLRPPANTTVDYAEVRQGLSNIGLNCSQNNDQTVNQVINNVTNACPSGGFGMRMSTEEDPPAWHWTIDQSVTWSSFMQVCLAKHAIISQNNIYPVTYNTISASNKQSTQVVLNDLFTDIAKIAGDLAQGSVDIPQMVKTISEQVGGMTTQSSSNYHAEKNNEITFFTSAEMAADNQSKAIAGSIYNYVIDINDYKNKKSVTHSFAYKVEQWSMIFTDETVFMNVYNEVSKA
jgi:hypothetical protein